jgi:hypothetical protein
MFIPTRNVTLMDEIATKWYKQTIVFEDSDSSGSTDLFNEYDVFLDTDSLYVNMDGVFIDDKIIGRQSKDVVRYKDLKLKKKGES